MDDKMDRLTAASNPRRATLDDAAQLSKDGAAAHQTVSLAKTRLRRKSRDKVGAFAGVSGPTVEKIAKVRP